MIKISELTPWKGGWSVTAASSLSGLALALAVGFGSMSAMLQSDDALAWEDCGPVAKLGSERSGTNHGPRGTGAQHVDVSPHCGTRANYQPGGERDGSDFPLTADENGNVPASPSEGNIVYSLRNSIAVQLYTPADGTDAVPRPWWQAKCSADDKVMCWTTGDSVPNDVPSNMVYYRLVEDDGTPDRASGTGDYVVGPATGTYGGVVVTTVIPIPNSDTAQVAAQKVDGATLAASDNNKWFVKRDSADFPYRVKLNLGWNAGAKVRGIKERVYLDNNGIPQRIDRNPVSKPILRGIKTLTATAAANSNTIIVNNVADVEVGFKVSIGDQTQRRTITAINTATKTITLDGGLTVQGATGALVSISEDEESDEDGFGRYAVIFDTTTRTHDIGWRVQEALLSVEGPDNTGHSVIEGGADNIPIRDNRLVDDDGGDPEDGGGIHFHGDAKRMILRLGHNRGTTTQNRSILRDTVIGRAKDNEFHAILFEQKTAGGTGDLILYDATVLMFNGGEPVSEEDQDRGMIVTTGDMSNGITVSVENPVGEPDSDGEDTGGIEVRVDTPVRIKTIGAGSHGIELNLGYGGTRKTAIKDLEKGAAVLLTTDDRNTFLQVALTEGIVETGQSDRTTPDGYAPSVRIATTGEKSGGIVIRNEGGTGESGAAVNLVSKSYSDENRLNVFPTIDSSLGNYRLIVDKPIVTMGTNSHGVKTTIGASKIMMRVDINGFRDDSGTVVKEDEVLTISTGDGPDTKFRAFDGSGSSGRFTVNVQGHVKGDIVTGDGVDRDNDDNPYKSDTINVGSDPTGDVNDWAPTIDGDIDTRGGDDEVTVVKGKVEGMVKSGAGCDKVELKASATMEGGSVSMGGCDRAGAQNVLITPFNLDNVEVGGNSKLDLTGGTTALTFTTVKVLEAPEGAETTVEVNGGTVTNLEFEAVAASTTTVEVGKTDQVSITNIKGNIGNDKLVLTDALVTGTINLGGGNDNLEWVSGSTGRISIDGGAGNDEVTLHSGSVTSMTGVETFKKKGTGTVTLPESATTAEAVTIEQGRLIVSGLLNLGSAGTLTVMKDTFLSIDIGGLSTQGYDKETGNFEGGTLSHGRIVGTVRMETAVPQIELVSGSAADNAKAKENTATTLIRLIGGNVVNSDGTDVKGSLNFTIGSEALPRPGTPGGNRAAVADDDDNTAIYAVGALAVLWWVMRRDDMGGGSGLVDYESGTASSFASRSGLRTHSSGAVKTWANYHSDSTATVQGLAVGLEAPISSRGSFSFTAMPEAKGSLSLNTLSLNQKSSFQGGHYSVKGKWQSEDYFAAAELSYADAVSSTSFDNSVVGGKLGGKFDMTNSHLEISAGTKVQLTDKVSVVPTVGVYGGSVSQSESVLTGRNVVARISKQEQSYAGWNLGLRVRPDAWTAGGAEFQPNISWNTFRTSSDRRSVDLRQSDKAGVLDFSSQLPVQGMPAVVNAFRAGMTMKSETGLQLDLDYVGMEIDGELQHGAIARMQTRF